MSGLETAVLVPIIVASINTVGLIVSELLGMRDPNNPNLCRSITQVAVAGLQYLHTKIKNQSPVAEEIEMDVQHSLEQSLSRPDWVKPTSSS
jgi:hypothetical protein